MFHDYFCWPAMFSPPLFFSLARLPFPIFALCRLFFSSQLLLFFPLQTTPDITPRRHIYLHFSFFVKYRRICVSVNYLLLHCPITTIRVLSHVNQ